MKNKLALILTLIILSSTIVLGELSEEELSGIKEKINLKSHLIPLGLKKIFGDVTAVVVIDGVNYTGISKNGILEALKKGDPIEPTMEILISQETVKELVDGKMGFSEAMNKNKVVYRPISKTSRVVYGVARLGRFVNKLFGR